MFTVFNTTGIKFNTKRTGVKKEGAANQCLSLLYGNRHVMDLYVPEREIETTSANFKQAKGEFVTWLDKTRLYYSNKDYAPIAMATKSNGANLLFLAHKLKSTERIIRVEFDGVFALTKSFKKGEYITTVASYRTDRDSSLTIVTIDGDTVYTTTYSANAKAEFKRTVETTHRSQYKKYDVESRGTIKPFRPRKATHLVFTTGKDKFDAEVLLNGANHSVISFNNQKELNDKIVEFKTYGFTAASLFSALNRDEPLAPIDVKYLQTIIDNFKTAHHVFEDGFTKVVSKKPELPKRNYKPKNGNRKPAGKKPNYNQNGKKIVAASTYGKNGDKVKSK